MHFALPRLSNRKFLLSKFPHHVKLDLYVSKRCKITRANIFWRIGLEKTNKGVCKKELFFCPAAGAGDLLIVPAISSVLQIFSRRRPPWPKRDQNSLGHLKVVLNSWVPLVSFHGVVACSLQQTVGHIVVLQSANPKVKMIYRARGRVPSVWTDRLHNCRIFHVQENTGTITVYRLPGWERSSSTNIDATNLQTPKQTLPLAARLFGICKRRRRIGHRL
jgi:hypothetical protein